MSMSENDFLKLIDDLEEKIPKPSDKDLERTRWRAELKDLLVFLTNSLGAIEHSFFDEINKKTSNYISSDGNTRKWKLEEKTVHYKNGFLLLRDWVKRKFKYFQLSALTASGKEKDYFTFNGLVTDFETKKIWKEGLKQKAKGFNESALLEYWKLLAANHLRGVIIKENEVEKLLRETGAEFHTLDKLHENLVQKLSTVGQTTNKVVGSWFDRADGNLALKN